MCSNFIENVQGYLSQCRDLENNHHERMLEIAIITLEKVVKNELDDEISEDLRMVRGLFCVVFIFQIKSENILCAKNYYLILIANFIFLYSIHPQLTITCLVPCSMWQK